MHTYPPCFADQYPGTDRLTFSNLTHVLRRVVIPRLLEQRHFIRRRNLLQGVLSYRYVDTVPPGNQQLILDSFVKVRELLHPPGLRVFAYSDTARIPVIRKAN